ncbi:MAG TPA: hypothetical protein VGN20_04315 [Mucilaginibacter sp.]|jgi:hypothetical protein
METQRENPITGKEGSPIDLDVAANWTRNYRDKHPKEIISEFFGKEILEKILTQENCLGIRFYYAYDKPLSGWQRCTISIANFITKVLGNVDGEKHLIIVGAMSDGSDQLNVKHNAVPEENKMMLASAALHTVGEMSQPCPGSPGCPSNVLTGQQ